MRIQVAQMSASLALKQANAQTIATLYELPSAFSTLPLPSVLPLDPLDRAIELLVECESGGNQKAINYEDAKINGAPSLGILQFSPKTFSKYAAKYSFRGSIRSAEDQRSLARLMLEEDPHNYVHWKNCAIATGVKTLMEGVSIR